ncbi:54S ribosomal protein L3 mitochondrial [Basidiobolus ranarum]|uniref:Large ribosomal subunit protein mL44 n=1 Tax=Basidiobolus ranarum TaxID=34480 RepID=A0ABR2VVA9_9FUNG
MNALTLLRASRTSIPRLAACASIHTSSVLLSVNKAVHSKNIYGKDVSSNSPTLQAFSARIGMKFSEPELMLQVVTHNSFNRKLPSNEKLEILGQKTLEMYVTEYLHLKYPLLPVDSFQVLLEQYTGPQTLAYVGNEMGIQHILRWKPTSQEENAQTSTNAMMAKAVSALFGAISHDKGAEATRKFVHAFILSRSVNLELVLPIPEPKRMLTALMKRLGKERPISRILKETGRHSNSPVFIVGVFSGIEKIGEGYGSSIKMAEHRAAKDALQGYYLKEVKDFDLPTNTELNNRVPYKANRLGDTPAVL